MLYTARQLKFSSGQPTAAFYQREMSTFTLLIDRIKDLGEGAEGCGPPPCFYTKQKPTGSRKVMFKAGVPSNPGYG